MILFLDTADFNNLRLALINDKFVREGSFSVAYNENYKTAAFLQGFLRKNRVQPAQLKKIIVCGGPGSFTGIRVGVALAQAMGFALNIPVMAIKKSRVPKNLGTLTKKSGLKSIILDYGRPANITTAK